MKLPYPKFLDRTPITIQLTSDIDINGKPNIALNITTKCIFNEVVKKVYSSDGKLIQLEGQATICGDIAPNLSQIEGYATIFNKEYRIYKGKRLRNPDGSVHHTELELV